LSTIFAIPATILDACTFKVGSDEYLVFTLPESAGDGDKTAAHDTLTASEREIVEQIVGGYSNTDIARSRGTSPRTIANQITVIYRKLGVTSRRELGVVRGRGPGRAS
jgi:DNA-binding NarL/FixJ family response regulator